MTFNLINITTKVNQHTHISKRLQNEWNLNKGNKQHKFTQFLFFCNYFHFTFFFIILYSQKILKWTQHNLHIIQPTSHTE